MIVEAVLLLLRRGRAGMPTRTKWNSAGLSALPPERSQRPKGASRAILPGHARSSCSTSAGQAWPLGATPRPLSGAAVRFSSQGRDRVTSTIGESAPHRSSSASSGGHGNRAVVVERQAWRWSIRTPRSVLTRVKPQPGTAHPDSHSSHTRAVVTLCRKSLRRSAIRACARPTLSRALARLLLPCALRDRSRCAFARRCRSPRSCFGLWIFPRSLLSLSIGRKGRAGT